MSESEAKVLKASLPSGYAFVPKGNVYITTNCRKLTQERGSPVFVVIDAKNRQVGIGVPTDIYLVVQFKEQDTRDNRAANVVKRDEGIAKGFEKDIMKEFPQIPPSSLRSVLKIALEKGKGKVGRTGKLDIRRKVHLAVRAHIRHCETDYDSLLRNGVAREDARQRIEAKIQDVCRAWAGGGGGSQTTRGKAAKTPKSPTRPNAKLVRQAAKSVEREKPRQAPNNTETSRLTAADSVDAILRAAETASPAENNNVFARRAMRARRRDAVEAKMTSSKTTRTRQQKESLYTSSAKAVPTAASFRERRTSKPRVIQPVEYSPPRKKPGRTKRVRETSQATQATQQLLGHEDRALVKRLVAQIGQIEHVRLMTGRRPMKKLRMIGELLDRINTILADANLDEIEPSAAARKHLVRRLGLAARAAGGS